MDLFTDIRKSFAYVCLLARIHKMASTFSLGFLVHVLHASKYCWNNLRANAQYLAHNFALCICSRVFSDLNRIIRHVPPQSNLHRHQLRITNLDPNIDSSLSKTKP